MTVPRIPPAEFPSAAAIEHHIVLIGATGSGKTGLLADLGAAAVRSGHAVVAFDSHGDLGPRLLSRLGEEARSRLVAIDPSRETARTVGVRILGDGPEADAQRDAAHVVATLRRLSVENGDLYWGFRLERIFDAVVRIAQEEQGDLRDVYALLTDPHRREASRLSTRDDESAQFLEELPAILRRNPEFLWAAAARLAKIVHDPRLGSLLAPRDGAVDLTPLLREGRSIVLRVPLGAFGPEASGFALSLLAGRLYHGLTANAGDRPPRSRVVFILDEAHLIASRLVVELLSDGRKFGVSVLLSTQFPERLAPELQRAMEGSAGTHLVFRVPRVGAVAAGAWVGLSEEMAARLLPALPPGMAVVSSLGSGSRRVVRSPAADPPDSRAWSDAVVRTTVEWGSDVETHDSRGGDSEADESLLLAAMGGGPTRMGLSPEVAIDRAMGPREAPPERRHRLEARLKLLIGRGYIASQNDRVELTSAGRAYLGLDRTTGATRESHTHRALLFEAHRIFAGHGHRLEILRQGRFDTRLPDAVFHQLSDRRAFHPRELAEKIDSARTSWAWRCFHGRDVHVEAEVSGALRPERIRRGLRKARAAGAFALFLVPGAHGGARVRAVLKAEHVSHEEAQVWTLKVPFAEGERSPPDEGVSSAHA